MPFPVLKVPFDIASPTGSELSMMNIKRKWGLVVSQCCDNEDGTYASVAWIGPQGGMTADQAAALANHEPGNTELGYTYGKFQLDPVEGILDQKNPNTPWAAELERATPFWGDVARTLVSRRRARMTPESRALLRTKLALLWGRIEGEDEAHFKGTTPYRQE